MKKLFAALLSLCLMLTAFAAFAEEEPAVVSWSDYEDQAAEAEGQFADVSNTGLKMFIPSVFRDTELSDEIRAGGTFLVLKTEDESAVVNAQLLDTEISLFRTAVTESGHSVSETVINGIHYIQFSAENDGIVSVCFAVPTEDDQTIAFSFTPADREPYAGLFRLMAASMQAAD